MLIDTHCHLHDRKFFSVKQAEEMLERARQNGVEKIICIGTDPADSLAARDFATTHDNVFWTYGIHPEQASILNLETVPRKFYEIFEASKACDDRSERARSKNLNACLIGIGEVGLDYHYDTTSRDQQIKLLNAMLDLALKNDLPVSFHVREAFDDFFGVIANFPQIHGVIHSFSDNKKNLKRILNETDFYIGVNGLATYSTLPTPPLERILLETDAPFLTPVPFRGIINEPGYVKQIAAWLASKLDQPFEIIEQETTKNARDLFHF